MPSAASVLAAFRWGPSTVAIARNLSADVRGVPPKLAPDGAHYGAPLAVLASPLRGLNRESGRDRRRSRLAGTPTPRTAGRCRRQECGTVPQDCACFHRSSRTRAHPDAPFQECQAQSSSSGLRSSWRADAVAVGAEDAAVARLRLERFTASVAPMEP